MKPAKASTKIAFAPKYHALGLLSVLVLGLGSNSAALTPDNPYAAIASRNAFALKPPTPVTTTPPEVVVAPVGIELQGITTILGKPQVFLKIKQPARPPKPPEDQSVVLEPGQGEGEVEVISIDAASGIVRLKNRGEELALNMKDHAATPSAAPATAPAPGGGLPRPAGLPAPAGVIPQPNPTAATTGGGVSATTIGGARTATGANTLPSRAIRSGVNPSGSTPTTQGSQPVRELTAVEQAALMEIERERTRKLVEEGKYPPLPPLPGLPE